jgi:hypothetical protein
VIAGNSTALSVSEVNRRAKQTLERDIGELWVEGELSGVSRPGSGHVYFTLKDERAQLRCALFRTRARFVATPMRDGDRVKVRGRLSIFEPRGDYQLIVEAVQAAVELDDDLDTSTVQEAAKRATESPLQTAQACHEVLEIAVFVTDLGAANAVPDAATGGSLAHAGLRASVWTARSNLGMLEDAEFVADAERRLDDLEQSGTELLASVESNVRETW